MRSRVIGGAVAAALSGLILSGAGPAAAQTVIDDWTNVKAPAPPELKPATADPKTTALLVLDFLKQNCGTRPSCVAAVPHIATLLTAARAKGMLVVYSTGTGLTPEYMPDVAPQGSEPVVAAGPDKFIGTDLDATLKAKGIKTVIVTGTAGNGAALGTASDAAQRGYNVIVPIDGIPSASPYIAQYVVYQLSVLPGAASRITLSRSDMVSF